MLVQAVVNGLGAGCAYAVFALGFGLILHITKSFHFVVAGIAAAGAYAAYALIVWLRWTPLTALPVAIVGSGLLGVACERLLFRRLRRAGGSPQVVLIASLGSLIVIQNLLSLVFGDASLVLREPAVREGMLLAGARVTPMQVVTVSIGLTAWAVLSAALHMSGWGRTVRAVATDSELAAVLGVHIERVVSICFGLGSSICTAAVVLVAYDRDLTPSIGFAALLTGVVAVVAGGVGSLAGTLLGGLLVGLTQHLGVLRLPTAWQDTVLFVILIAFLILRPQGFRGRAGSRA